MKSSKKGADAANPLWVQKRAAIDAETYNPSRHEKLYAGGSGSRQMSGLAGHNLCFPYWGDPSDAEARAGMTYHGEDGVVRWKRTAGGSDCGVFRRDGEEHERLGSGRGLVRAWDDGAALSR